MCPLRPDRLWPIAEVRKKMSIVPAERGIYAWYFVPSALPSIVPVSNCWKHRDLPLLYVGICPDRRSAARGSLRTLRSRLNAHINRDAGHSNFRRYMGCVLAPQLGLRLLHERHPEFISGVEDVLNNWLDANAFICCLPHASAWEMELSILREYCPPLNAGGNPRPWKLLKTLTADASKGCGPCKKHQRRWSLVSPATQRKEVSSMTGVEALTHLVERYPDKLFSEDELIAFLKEHAPNRSAKGLPTLLLNCTTNVRRKVRSWTYGEKGYNLLFRLELNGMRLYRRYQPGIDPEPVS